MGKNKLKKFAEMQSFSCVFQYPWAVLEREGFPLIGKWGAEYFGNDNPIVLELGCGKGEYTVGLARKYPEKNFIGIGCFRDCCSNCSKCASILLVKCLESCKMGTKMSL